MNFKDDEKKNDSNDRLLSIKNHSSIELRTKPSEILVFSSFNPIELQIFNDNTFPIIFKLKTTQPNILISQPARGFIPSQSFLQCLLTPLEKKSHIFLVIQYAQIIHPSNDYLTQWKSLKSNKIYLKKFQCLFDQSSSHRNVTLIKPMLLTFATITLLTTLIYWRNK